MWLWSFQMLLDGMDQILIVNWVIQWALGHKIYISRILQLFMPGTLLLLFGCFKLNCLGKCRTFRGVGALTLSLTCSGRPSSRSRDLWLRGSPHICPHTWHSLPHSAGRVHFESSHTASSAITHSTKGFLIVRHHYWLFQKSLEEYKPFPWTQYDFYCDMNKTLPLCLVGENSYSQQRSVGGCWGLGLCGWKVDTRRWQRPDSYSWSPYESPHYLF